MCSWGVGGIQIPSNYAGKQTEFSVTIGVICISPYVYFLTCVSTESEDVNILSDFYFNVTFCMGRENQ